MWTLAVMVIFNIFIFKKINELNRELFKLVPEVWRESKYNLCLSNLSVVPEHLVSHGKNNLKNEKKILWRKWLQYTMTVEKVEES